MGTFKIYFLVGVLSVLSFIGYKGYLLILPPSIPEVDENVWWGSEITSGEDESVKKFTINISEKIIDDLKWRLQNHRPLIPSIEGTGNQYGTNSQFLEEIIDYWKLSYNWTERQAYLNKYPQFVTKIQGLDIHYIHVKPKERDNKKVLPILLLHGWPGTVREFYDVTEILTTVNEFTEDKEFLLEVIVPSLPGYGFSQGALRSGLAVHQIAVIMKKLMNRLGHQKFYVQGGDLGSLILQTLCVLYPASVLGFHTNFPVVYTIRSYLKPMLGLIFPSLVVRPEHYDRVYPFLDRGLFIFQESGYLHIQSTKPDSIGVAINESPVGLAAYFLEKFITGSNFSWINDFNPQDLNRKISYTNLLDNLMVYWVTGTATTAFRLYYETFSKPVWSDSLSILRMPVQVPTVIFRSKYDLYMPDGVLGEIFPSLLNITDYDTGHFAAFENPEVFSQDLLNAIEKFIDHQN